ncbi:MAG: hypothetical protein V7L22_13530 [Nostoc sp.]|uniref:hypothetical protein n=1 Tax=Nostoc sp. TaxID=1180 RepID=UPI002FFC73A8
MTLVRAACRRQDSLAVGANKIKDIPDGDLARNAVLGKAQVERFLKTNPDLQLFSGK